jgi:hypothetical protein
MRVPRSTSTSARLIVLLALAGACAKVKAPEPSDPAFDQKWTSLASNGVEALYIEDDRAEGLMGNVRRVTKPAAPPPLAAPPAASPEALPATPSGDDLQRVIRGNLTAVRGCYMSMTRSGLSRSGKAIVTFTVGADGKPADVRVDAPSFSGTPLPGCVSSQVARWSFPKSQKGGATVSYPFVFVGG